MKIHPAFRENVAFLYVYNKGAYQPLGTCFFVAMREEDHFFLYLVTCKHVVKAALDQGIKLFVRLNRSDKADTGFIELDSDWHFHDDISVDIAVYHVVFSSPVPYQFTALPSDDLFLTEEKTQEAGFLVSEGVSIMFIGMFTQVTGTHRNIPIMRYGHIAMMPDEKIRGEYGYSDYILVECEAYPGNSGSPVYLGFKYKDRPTIFVLGVMTGIYLEQEVWVANGQVKTYHNTGISLVVPVRKVIDILNGDVLMKKRQDLVGGEKLNDRPLPISNGLLQGESDDTPLTRESFMDALIRVTRPDKPGNDDD